MNSAPKYSETLVTEQHCFSRSLWENTALAFEKFANIWFWFSKRDSFTSFHIRSITGTEGFRMLEAVPIVHEGTDFGSNFQLERSFLDEGDDNACWKSICKTTIFFGWNLLWFFEAWNLALSWLHFDLARYWLGKSDAFAWRWCCNALGRYPNLCNFGWFNGYHVYSIHSLTV